MRKDTVISVALVCWCLVSPARCADKDEAVSPEALISGALAVEDIRSEGTPPLLIRGDVQIPGAKGAVTHGAYAFSWVSPSRWREEIRFGNYERIRVREAKGYWQKSNLNYQPEIIFRLDRLFELKRALKVEPKQSLGKVKSGEKDGEKCTEVKSASKRTVRTMCFDKTTGALIRIDYPGKLDISRIEYGAFTAVGGKLVPCEVRALEAGELVLTVKVLEVVQNAEENPLLFKPLADAEFWPQCEDMQDAELKDKVQPSYPVEARTHRESGRVTLYAVIETDGSLSHIAIVHAATPTLAAATVEAVHRWHYKPAMCGQTPIRTEISIHVYFYLGY